MDEKKARATFLTRQDQFVDVSRGKPKPFTLKGDALTAARLTPEAWRLEIVSDGSAQLAKPRQLADGTALTLADLQQLGAMHSVRFLKAMQCNNIPVPLGQGLWEGVPLREVLRLVGKVSNVRRVYYWGFHNEDPAQLFQSSLCYNQALETPPGDLPPFLAYRLNGEPISLLRGGPVRLIVPWAHGFKSIKWLRTIVLTNDHRANDTYANQNNDPDSYLKTAAYFDSWPDQHPAGKPIRCTGTAMVGWSGLARVEYWLRPDQGTHGTLALDDPAWQTAQWHPAEIDPPPAHWPDHLPAGIRPADIGGFDPATGKPKTWPLRYSLARWSLTLTNLPVGAYELRVRTVDLNGFAQPEPRPYQKSGMNLVPCKHFTIGMT